MTSSSSLSKARFVCGALCLGVVALAGCAHWAVAVELVLAVTVLTLLCGLALLLCLRNAARAMRQCRDACDAVAAGDFEARIIGIREHGDVGEMMWAINGLIDRTDAYIRETTASMDYVSRNRYYRGIVETGMVGAFLGGAKTINAATDSIATRVGDFRRVAQTFESTISGVVSGVVNAATELDATAGAMETIARGTQEQAATVSDAAERTSMSAEALAGASEQLSASIAEIGAQAGRSSEIGNDVADQIAQSHARMENLTQAADRIGEVVGLITKIAGQTNLLALNATIEAARAGEAGKGFAVVAEEVKQLAAHTAQATEEVSTQVAAIQEATHDATGRFGRVADAVREISDSVSAIAAAVEQQSAATQEIANGVAQASTGATAVTGSIERVSAGAQETSGAADNVLGASNLLAGEAERLRGEVDGFLTQLHKVV